VKPTDRLGLREGNAATQRLGNMGARLLDEQIACSLEQHDVEMGRVFLRGVRGLHFSVDSRSVL